MSEFVLDGDIIAPRVERERYRLYRVRDEGAPELIATAATPEAVGVALCTLGAEEELLDVCVGVLDGMDHEEHGQWVGKWVILPWQAKTPVLNRCHKCEKIVEAVSACPTCGSWTEEVEQEEDDVST